MSGLEFWHHHGGVSVPNLDEAIEWYCAKLGFEVEKRFFAPPIPAEIAIIKNGDLRMELFAVEGAQSLPEDRRTPNLDLKTHGNKHIAFAIDDVENFSKVLEERNVDIVWVKKFEFGSNIFIRDNSGNLIEFLEEKRPQGELGKL
jgi:methylmalonyl-CoA/ethylmalonyl-CoA epimerase